jgi:hypothetical protein
MNDSTDQGAAATSPGDRRTLRGDDARALILEQIKAHNNGLLTVLGRYEASDTIRKWHQTIRAIEEFINVPLFGIDDENVVRDLLSVRLDESFLQNPGVAWLSVKAALSPYFDPSTVDRFCRLMVQIATIRSAFVLHGQSTFGYGITLDTVAEAMNYLQSRRRHFVALLYLMPRACQGSEKLAPLDALNVLLPQVEHSCVTITSLYLKLALADALPDFSMEIDDVGGAASHWLETLDAGFIDPERASIVVMNELRGDQICAPTQEVVDPKKIFSAAELRNSIRLLGATYDAFGLNDSDFATIAAVVTSLSRRCQDDYVVAIGKPKLRALLKSHGGMDASELERLLVSKPSGDYVPNTNAFEPFIDVGDAVVSNVNLLSRFVYAFKNIHLGSRRRFQIHAGFIFEDVVKRDLEEMGFNVTDIKRINRKEFDVVTTLGGVIYNFQCKNNWIDLAKVESDRALYVRYNRALTNYYAKALVKEEGREQLLRDKLGIDKVEHYVISRFPVMVTDPRIICYNKIDELATLVERAQKGASGDTQVRVRAGNPSLVP